MTSLATAIEDLRITGGLVVLVAGPGCGATFALEVAAEHFGRAGWDVLGAIGHSKPLGSPRPGADAAVLVVADGQPFPPIAAAAEQDPLDPRTVTVVALTAGLPWPPSVSAAAGHLADAARLRVIRLPALDSKHTAELIDPAGAKPMEAAALAASAAGNPVIARHLARQGPTPDPVLDRVVVDRLLDRFGPETRAVAEVLAAVAPLSLADLSLVAELADVAPATAAQHFDVLIGSGLLAASAPDTYCITISWLSEALYSGLGPARREQFHRAAITHLTAEGSPRLARAAQHFLRVSTLSRADVALLLTLADDLTNSDPAAAADGYRRALAHLSGPAERVAEVSARLARASLLAGRPDDTVDVGLPLLDDLRATSAEMYPWLLPVVTEAMMATSAVEEAETMLRSGDAGIDELLDTQAAYLFAASGREEQAQTRIRRSRATLSTRSVRGQVNLLSNMLHAECISGDFTGLRKDAATLAGIVDQTPPEAQLHAWATLAHVRSVEGDLAAGSIAASRAESLLRGATWGVYVPSVRYARAAIAFADGHWDEALQIASTADAPLAQSGTVSYLHLMRHLRARVLANRGDFIDARRLGESRETAPQLVTAMRTLTIAEIEILEGRAADSASRLTLALQVDALPGQVRAELLSGLARAAAALGDISVVGDCWAQIDQRFGISACSRHVRMELVLAKALAAGSRELAQDVLREATDHGFKLFEARALLILGCLDVDAETTLTEAMRVFGDLNAVPWRRATAIELRDRGLRIPRRARTSADHLTETEVQLARLVQAARSNKDIAHAMSLSVKTVEVYLSRLYVKVGCKNRLDLARAADEGRLPLDGLAPAPIA